MLALTALTSAAWADPPPTPAVTQQFEVLGGHYLVAAPPDYHTGDRPPLILALHGTNTDAEDMVGVWRTLDLPVPCLIAAPQNPSAGWQDAEAALIEETYRDLRQRFTFDVRRVLLTGHSAGGAMAMYMLYQRGFRATALATSANYLPPTVTREQVREHADVPLFYAVGRKDINHRRMREALVLLRTSGANVTVLPLDIGHVLQRGVIQQAALWFARVGDQRLGAVLDGVEPAFENGQPALAVRTLEEILEQQPYYSPQIIERARALYRSVTMPANHQLYEIRELIAAGQKIQAVERLARLEATYATCTWAETPARLRRRLEADPDVAELLRIHRRQQRCREAETLLADVKQLIAIDRPEQARAKCALLSERYGDLPQGRQAAQLLKKLDWTGG
jgi:predicted esterase